MPARRYPPNAALERDRDEQDRRIAALEDRRAGVAAVAQAVAGLFQLAVSR